MTRPIAFSLPGSWRFASSRWALHAHRVRRAGWRIALITTVASSAFACDVNRALEQIVEARRLSADLLVQFTKASDAANRAVMADTDEASLAFAHEAEQATEVIPKDAEALGNILKELGYSDEIRLLSEFNGR